jgi:hypothetical protein
METPKPAGAGTYYARHMTRDFAHRIVIAFAIVILLVVAYLVFVYRP